ncbi:hypothetical protein [Polaribacter ponticola]|uniref:Uncharacterized protein n=1 Tax=Polaribacter ponticola TaxID=2978475 RepID=A0ABT5S6N9_9FLAO|nr:hypothetical protein [Polaribacter sp. MSW5]MDD7913765.1 hypothetical protein [Polaribacter sp. MSW5]MDD7913790.1 hypothetical protein [Polaribacter sp. MSW5]
MKIKILNLLLILTLCLFTSCDNEDTTLPELNIRVSNVSQFNFENAKIGASTENGNINIQKLNSGEITEYKSFNKAQLFPHIE